MNQTIEAIYQDGKLILDKKLSDDKEGKRLKILLMEEDDLELKKEKFFLSLEKHRFSLPKDYQFNRDKIIEV